MYCTYKKPVRTTHQDGQSCEIDYVAEANRISTILDSLPASPCDTLVTLMSQRKVTVEDLIEMSGASKRTVTRLRTNREYRPTKETAIAICVGLHLEPPVRRDWMQKLAIPFSTGPTDLLYEMLLDRYYVLSLSEFNEKLKECGLPSINECAEELTQQQ